MDTTIGRSSFQSESVAEETRIKAQTWLMHLQDEVQGRLGYQFTVPWIAENPYEDEILYQWNMTQPPQRWLHVYIDKDEISYLRAENKDPHCEMLEGSAEDIEVCRLLWHWFTCGK